MELNAINIVGNLTRDPETRQVGDTQVCNLGVAINKRRKGESYAIYLDVKVWGNQAANCQQYLQKGQKIAIVGELDQECYQNRDGQEVKKLVIVASKVSFGPSPQIRDQQGGQASQPRQTRQRESDNYDYNRDEAYNQDPHNDMPF